MTMVFKLDHKGLNVGRYEEFCGQSLAAPVPPHRSLPNTIHMLLGCPAEVLFSTLPLFLLHALVSHHTDVQTHTQIE
jgi:hypothetical protein